MSKPIFLAFCLLGLRFPDFLHASGDASTRAADRIEEIRKRHAKPGIMVGYFTSAGEFDLKVCGVRRIGTDDRLQADDPMHLGSCTKSMTATLVGILVDEGKLRWDSTLGEIFAEDEVIQKSEWSKVTVDHLIRHTSGAPGNLQDLSNLNPLHPSNPTYWSSQPLMEQRRRLVTFLAQQPLPGKPSSYQYSNVGYMVLGAIIEKNRGHSWEVEMERRIFIPLGIKSSGFGAPSKIHPFAPLGHTKIGDVMVDTENDNPPIGGPAGTLHMSMDDWVKYLRLHVLPEGKGEEFLGVNDLDPFIPIRWQTLRHLHTPSKGQEYAGGWIVAERPWAGGIVLHHAGSNTHWYSVVWLAPLQNRGFIAASNFGLDAAKACDEAVSWMIQQHPPPKK